MSAGVVVADRWAEALSAGPSTSKFFDALDAADRVVAQASYNQLLAGVARTPDTFARCCCGAQFIAADNSIRLDDEDIDAAADTLADSQGTPTSTFHRRLVTDTIAAINKARAQIAAQDQHDFWLDHNECHQDFA